jgi:hypothetical protein
MALTAMMFPLTVSPLSAQTQIDARYPIHDRNRPLPPVVDHPVRYRNIWIRELRGDAQ